MSAEFAGTERFEILRRLGAGGMGVVYEAFDRTRRERVALKTMHRLDAATIYRFKKEFRALADMSHPNLVTLYELFSTEGEMFFTMQLVDGVPFHRHVSELVRAEQPFAATVPAAAPTPPSDDSGDDEVLQSQAIAIPQRDEARLRKAIGQLAVAVHALHVAGKLHRDIKPSNVLVTPEGRLVLLDFGLVMDIDPDGRGQTTEEVAGTAEYMAPEQAAAMPLSEASDWYSVGIILYESLTGTLPFQGRRLQVLMDKQMRDPPPPSAVVGEVPLDLEKLCIDLIQRSPEARPRGADVLRRLGIAPGHDSGRHSTVMPTLAAPFFGRESHLAILERGFESLTEGKPVTVLVHGASGMGKSVLIRRFLEPLGALSDTVVLIGRCYEQESVPFKAFDGIIDALSREMVRRKAEAAALLPREVHTLARVFPVLRRVDAIASAPRPSFETPDPQELRRRAFAALRELFGRFGDRQRVVLWIDDLQWGDADSAALIAELLRPPHAPLLMLIASYRTEDSKSAAFLTKLSEEAGDDGREVNTIAVGPLAHADAVALATVSLGGGEAAMEHASIIATEAAGSPFFIDELARFVQGGVRKPHDGNRSVSLDEVLRGRADQLPAPARRLLETLAVAGRPIAREVAVRAADVTAEEERATLAVLRAGRLIRTLKTGDEETLVTFHDRVRESVAAGLAKPDLLERHRRIATALEGSARPDEEALALHWEAADDAARARDHAIRAADRSADALAFDRACILYRTAIRLTGDDGDGRHELLCKLADALANAGRGEDAGKAYLAATKSARGADVLELQRRAAEQFLRSGHIDDGVATLRLVLSSVGMKLPDTARAALFFVLLRMVWIALRGLGYRERDRSQITTEDITRIDICWSVNAGLAVVDNMRSIDFQKRQLLLALRAGEPYRVARALATECASSSIYGTKSAKKTDRLGKLATDLAERVEQPHARGFATLVLGIAAFLRGEWRKALGLCEKAERVFRDRCTGVWWEIANTSIFSLWSLTQVGDLDTFAKRQAVLLDEARARGDLYLFTNLQIGRNNIRWLMSDEPARAEQIIDEAMSRWPKSPFHLQHYYALLGRCQADLYVGNGARARARIDQHWGEMASAMMLRIQNVMIEACHLRARCALSAARAEPEAARGPLLRTAARDVRRMQAQGAPWSLGLATLIRAGIAVLRGERSHGAELLDAAATDLDRYEMRLCAIAARRARGTLLDGDEGKLMVEAADAAMRAQGIVDPVRMTEMMAPGCSVTPSP